MSILEKIGLFLSFCMIICLLFIIIFAKNGVIDYREFKIKQAEIDKQITKIEEKNKKMEYEIFRLKNDLNYIKHLAKREHEMSEPEELIFKKD